MQKIAIFKGTCVNMRYILQINSFKRRYIFSPLFLGLMEKIYLLYSSNITVLNDEQYANAYSPINSMFFEIVKLVNDVQP